MSQIKAFKKIPVTDRDTNKVQDNIQTFVEPLINNPMLDGTLVTNICLLPLVSNEVVHGLNRKPLGWVIVRKRHDSRIWDLQDTNADPSKTLSIACSHPCQIDLWVF
jgi:hypothetical protein